MTILIGFSAVSQVDSFERRATLRALTVMTIVALTASTLATLGRITALHERFPILAQFAFAKLPGNYLATAAFISLTYLYRRGAGWPVRAVSVTLAVLLIPGMRDVLFSVGAPQIVWIPTLVAFTLTTVRWMVVTMALSVVLALTFHGHMAGLQSAPVLFASSVIGTLLVLARTLHDHSISNERDQAREIEKLAFFDTLTKLPNRRLLVDRLDEALKRAKRANVSVAVLFIDLDRFKEINDTLGHKAGDQLLVAAAQRIMSCVRSSDTVSRFGGDEFIVVLPDLKDRMAAGRIAAEINKRLAATFMLADKSATVSGSVGIALYPDDGEDHETLFKHADQALYHSKASGRDQFCFFMPSLQEAANSRRQLTEDLRNATHNREQLELFYQPIVTLSSGEVLKAEALLRWHHPDLGPVSPATFIPLAESSGLIHPLGDWVLEMAAAQVKCWHKQIAEGFQVSVNWSPVQFRSQAECTWRERLDRLDLQSGGLAIEITEGVLVDKTAQSVQQFECLRRAGIALAIDDFGTGYSGLAYLERYTVDYLKIDKSFVHVLTPEPRTQALCKGIIVMAHALKMKVIAEGVETQEQHELLLAAGADFAQGYWYAAPMPASEFTGWLERRVHERTLAVA